MKTLRAADVLKQERIRFIEKTSGGRIAQKKDFARSFPSFMLNITDKNFFIEITADAVAQAHLTCPETELRNWWVASIAEAAAIILEAGDAFFFRWDYLEKTLYGWSKDEREIRTASETACQFRECQTIRPAPCRHRALSRLARNYFELQRKPRESVQIDFADAVFLDRELTARRKIELLNVGISTGRAELKPLVRALEKSIEFEKAEN